MPDIVFWPLFVTFTAIAIGTTLRMVEALQAKKLSDDECSRLRVQIEVLNKEADNKTVNIQPVSGDELPIMQPERMEKIKDDILTLLSKNPNTQTAFFAHSTNIGEQVALHHLEAMQDKKLVSYYWRTKEWKLQPAGREYLVQNSLIS